MPDWFQAALDSLPSLLSFVLLLLYLILPLVGGWFAYRYRVGLKRVEGELENEKHEREKGRLEMQSQMNLAEKKATERVLELKNAHEREMAELRNMAEMQKAQHTFSERLLAHLSEMTAQNRQQHESFIASNKEMTVAIHDFGEKTITAASRMEAAVARDNRKLHMSLDELPHSIAAVLGETLTPIITEFVSGKASDVSDAVKAAVGEHEKRAQERHEGLHGKVIGLEERITSIEGRLSEKQHDKE